MQETLQLLQSSFHHLVGALPQIRSFNGIGNTLYAIVIPSDAGGVTLSGPALAADGTSGWPCAAAIAARDFYLKKQRRKCSITVLLIISIAGAWHCVPVNIPMADRMIGDDSVPLSCANSVLENMPPDHD